MIIIVNGAKKGKKKKEGKCFSVHEDQVSPREEQGGINDRKKSVYTK